MFDTVSRAGAFTVYQTALLVGILVMPLALAARKVGVHLPLGDVVAAAARTYESKK
jgi:hypothetical protein